MRNLRYTLLSFIVAATAMLPGRLSAQIALTNDTDGAAFALVADGRAAAIAIDGSDAEVVTTAATMLSGDIEAVSGLKPALTDTPSGTAVIAGTSPDSHIITYHRNACPLYADSDTMIHCAVAPYTCSPIDYRGIAVYRTKALCYMTRQPHGTNLRQEYVKEMPCSPYAHIEYITKLRLIYQRTAQRPYKQDATNGIVPISRPRQNILVYHTALTSAQYIAYNMRYDSWHIKPNLQPVHIHHSAHIIITN